MDKQNKLANKYAELRAQIDLDAAIMAVGEIFNADPEQAIAFGKKMMELENNIMELVINDAKDDAELVYTKATLDRGLAQVLGQENLVPYDIRYGSRI